MKNKRLNDSIESLRRGQLIIIYDADDRESEGDFAFAASHATPNLVNFCIKKAGGLLCVSITQEKAAQIGIKRQESNGKDMYGTPFANPINSVSTSSGISAQDRCKTLLDVSKSDADETMFYYPGHVHTLIAHPMGLAGRDGHTEAVLDILSLSGIEGPGVLCEILNEDGTTAKLSDLVRLSEEYSIPLIRVDEIKNEKVNFRVAA